MCSSRLPKCDAGPRTKSQGAGPIFARIMHARAMDTRAKDQYRTCACMHHARTKYTHPCRAKNQEAMQAPRAKEQEPKTKSQRPRVRKEKDRKGKSRWGGGQSRNGGQGKCHVMFFDFKALREVPEAGCSKLSVTWSQNRSSSLDLSHGRNSYGSSDLFDNGAPLPPTWDKRCCMSSPTMLDKTMVVPRATQLC